MKKHLREKKTPNYRKLFLKKNIFYQKKRDLFSSLYQTFIDPVNENSHRIPVNEKIIRNVDFRCGK